MRISDWSSDVCSSDLTGSNMMETETLKIINGRIVTPYRVIHGGTLLIRNGLIAAISRPGGLGNAGHEGVRGNAGEDEPVSGVVGSGGAAYEGAVIDSGGNFVAPGFIDITVPGGGGHDFMDGTERAFLKIAENQARYGTTAMVPTTLYSGIG